MKARSLILAAAGALALMTAIPTAEASGPRHHGYGGGYGGGYEDISYGGGYDDGCYDYCGVSYGGGYGSFSTYDIQSALSYSGFHISVDGVFGSETHHAVKAFQQAVGLVPDGIVGPATASALGL